MCGLYMHILSLKWSTYLSRTIGVLICNCDYFILFFMPLDLEEIIVTTYKCQWLDCKEKSKQNQSKEPAYSFITNTYIDLETHSQTLYFERGKKREKWKITNQRTCTCSCTCALKPIDASIITLTVDLGS